MCILISKCVMATHFMYGKFIFDLRKVSQTNGNLKNGFADITFSPKI